MKYFKIIPVVFLILLLFVAYRQDEPISLDKCSYFLAAGDMKGGDLFRHKGNGTGFFIKSTDGNMYLIANYHVLSGYSCENDSVELKFTGLMIRLPQIGKKEPKDFTIISGRDSVLEKKIKANSAADIVALNVNYISKKSEINDISKFIDTSYFGKKPDSIFFYGYPSKKQTKKSISERTPIEEKRYGKYFEPIPIKKTKNDSLYFDRFYKFHTAIKDILAEPGMSGSPVFGVFKEKGFSKIQFIGVLRGQPNGLQGVMIINAREVLNAIKNAYKL